LEGARGRKNERPYYTDSEQKEWGVDEGEGSAGVMAFPVSVFSMAFVLWYCKRAKGKHKRSYNSPPPF